MVRDVEALISDLKSDLKSTMINVMSTCTAETIATTSSTTSVLLDVVIFGYSDASSTLRFRISKVGILIYIFFYVCYEYFINIHRL